MNAKVLLVGSGAREHALAAALARSKSRPSIFAWMKQRNPGIAALADEVRVNDNYHDVIGFARDCEVGLAIIGPEGPLRYGLADALTMLGIPTVGPTQRLALIETEKSYARILLERYRISGNPKFMVFTTISGVRKYIEENEPVVLKPNGLTGGKGVVVQGEHFSSMTEALAICRQILIKHQAMVIEEKLQGEEFSLQCFCDGTTIIPCPPVQDHKRRLVGDHGLNTGSMGSYTSANHLLPFLKYRELQQATDIVRRTIQALQLETGEPYRGIIYGGFMLTAQGVKLIEFNARFGDPEAINVLALLRTDFLDICRRIACREKYGGLNQLDIRFRGLATVVKYVVPVNYGLPKEQWVATVSDLLQIGDLGKAALYYSSVHSDQAGLHLTKSRAVAVLGMAPELSEAEGIAERAACAIIGAVDHRSDIGTAELIARRVQHMKELRRQ
ncbi:MAG: Phosphoribosylamine-glycine ligase [Parcubacteria group bacterium GW2011_GWC2_42_12]|nr:MAG: Phosphoribosylamine-glycine ligase [Parcubacteria group bacterium GW2011_GWC2_42_12]